MFHISYLSLGKITYALQTVNIINQKNKNIIIVGDFNIAPKPHDVWSHKQMLKVVSHTPIEVEKLTKMQASLDFIDTHRMFVDDSQKLYSWWSYRGRDWRVSDRGRRLDHIWISQDLKPKLKSYSIAKEARGWHLPSDHVPVLLELEL